MRKIAKLIGFLWLFFWVSQSFANTFYISPVGTLPTTVRAGQTVFATYNVTSIGIFEPTKYHIILAMLSHPENVLQDITVPNACTLNPINSNGCSLKLNITGAVSGPVKVCDDFFGRPGLSCNIPANPNDFLAVSATAGPPAVLTLSPSVTLLGPNRSQQFIIINTSSRVAAENITMTVPTNIQNQLVGLPTYNGCASIAPLGSCTITITAVAAPSAQSGIAIVQGTNTAAAAPTVAITTGAAPAITVSPALTVLGPNGSQQFILTNVSGTITAQNITMTVPANVQGQLIGLPTYNGCASIAPLATCTINITAVAAPSAQSGIATVQGTNTAAPAPTVAITTGAAPVLTVSPALTVLGPNGSQQFTVTNASGTITAQNITMTVPANVQGQLIGLPTYNGCASIAPLATCTITITAVAAPSAQSGIATVQGTNTAAPAPTVAITTGAAPAITVSPALTVLGPNGSQQFTVTNASGTIAAQNITMTVPPNVQGQLIGLPTYNGCASIAPLATCTITITAVAAPSAQSGIATVQGTNTAAPAPTVAITTGAAPALTVSPALTVLGPNGSQQFIVTNASGTITAQNITMTVPPNVQGQLIGLPTYNGCASIAPLATCTITITAVAAPSAQSGTATVQGTNTAAPAPTVAITTGAAPALTVSPPLTVLGPNGSQQFTVTNASGTITAQNITMTVPANIQNQLIGLPTYNGCASIAPLGSCTITITAVAAPSAQSGTATVQGTNTAAPAPTVTITTGAAPALTISPPLTVLGPNGSQQFTVTNASGTITAQNITMTVPANIQNQLTGLPTYNGCASIAPLATCTITITAVAAPAAQSGTATVQGTNTAVPAPTVAITTGAAPALTVSPALTVLGPNGSQQFTVTNASGTITAQNITMTVPANIQNQLIGLPTYNGCASIAPLGSCTITITAVAAPSAQSGTATVQGTNTAAPAPTVAITTGAAPAITVSPALTVLGPNGSQQFIVTNASGTITAQNITMAVPINIQNQLIGSPVYSGCTSIAPLGSCTITITAIASPSAQSGIATVQGTNTAAPAPTVAITTGAAPGLTVSPSFSSLNFNATQVFTVTNNGVIPALNISMIIPTNVQNQLVGLPTYSAACTSLPAGSNGCTITIQVISAPSSQSGIATVQGSNTSAPAPQVTINILPICTVLGATTVTNAGLSVITNSVCVAPGVAITGFPPGQTTPAAGQLHANDSIATSAHSDAVNLFNSISAMTCQTPLSQDLGGMTLTPGVYCFGAGATLVAGGTLTFNGSATDKWYIQIVSTLTTGANSNINLMGSARAENIFWQIGSSATFGASTAFQGQVIGFTSLTLGAGTSNVGRLWALNAAITLDTNNIGS